MPWKDDATPNPPAALTQSRVAGHVRLSWEAPGAAPDGDEASWYAVYRFDAVPNLPADLERAEHLIAVVPGDSLVYTDRTADASVSYHYAVTALDRLWNESEAVSLVATNESAEYAPGAALRLLAPQPNPSPGETVVRFVLAQPAPVTARVYSATGQHVSTLAQSRAFGAGTHTLRWLPGGLASGAYFLVVETPAERETLALTLLK
jgi:hypothetical protein